MGIPGREAATCACPGACQNGGFAGLISQNWYPLLPATRQDARLSRSWTSMISGRPSEPKRPKAHCVMARTADGAMPRPLAPAAVQ